MRGENALPSGEDRRAKRQYEVGIDIDHDNINIKIQ